MKRLRRLLASVVLATPLSACAVPAPPDNEAGHDAARARLVASISDYADTVGERADPSVLQAMRTVPRHLFVPAAHRAASYRDHPLPIGEDQTISQPSLVALMTHLLRPEPHDVMLEVGTGSGYQAAILSRLVAKVYSVEIVGPLARTAADRLAQLGYHNVEVRHGDGYAGWPERAPFDGIIVTAGAPHVPQPLIDQLKPGGRMVIPVGSRDAGQDLRLITKSRQGEVQERTILPVLFVPLTRLPGA